jgi:hypothetical protein
MLKFEELIIYAAVSTDLVVNPYTDTVSFAVYQAHKLNLLTSLNDVCLIDAYGVDPNAAAAIRIP